MDGSSTPHNLELHITLPSGYRDPGGEFISWNASVEWGVYDVFQPAAPDRGACISG